jgi:drug/metabolite transporter (DMT)-like permease
MNPATAIAIGLTIVLWASAFVGIRAALVDYSPYHLAIVRYGIASLVLVPIAIIKRIRFPRLSDIPHFFLLGALGFTIYNFALNIGEQTVSAASACFIINMIPIMTAIISFFFLGERIRPAGWMGMLWSLAGIGLIAFGEGKSGISFEAGSLFILIAAVSSSLYFVGQKPLLERYTSLEVVCYVIWLGTLAMLPGVSGVGHTLASASPASTLSVVYLGVFPAVVAYFCWSYVLARMPASRAATFLYIVPLVTIVIGFLWLNEIPTMTSLLGGIIVISGVFIVNTYGKA